MRVRKTYSDYGVSKKIVKLQEDVIKYKTNQRYGISQIRGTYIGTHENTPYHYRTTDPDTGDTYGYYVLKGIYHVTGSYPNRPIQTHLILGNVPGYHSSLGAQSSIEYVAGTSDNTMDIYIIYYIDDAVPTGGDFVANVKLYANMSATWTWEDLGWQLAP